MASQEIQHQLPGSLPRLWRFALRLTRDKTDAEDLVQRCCVRALERQWQWRPGSSLLSWLFAIMHNLWLNEVRTRQRRRETNLGWETEWAEAISGEQMGDPLQATLYRQIVAAVDALPEAQRLVMLLVAVEGLTYKEAADVLAIPIGTVMSRLARARSTLGRQFQERKACVQEAARD